MSESQGLLIIERILRDRTGVFRQVSEDRNLKPLIGKLLLSAAIALAGYGAVMGASNGWLQAASSAVKLPGMFLVTLAICLPTLYLFNLVLGSRLSVRQAVTLVSIAINVMAMLAVAFAPIALFFLITAPHYLFYKVLNVGILALTGLVGMAFLVRGMRSLNLIATTKPDESAVAKSEAKPANMALLYVWTMVFGFVGTQLAWTLRPFLGSPDEDFAVVRQIEGNFYVDIGRTLAELLF